MVRDAVPVGVAWGLGSGAQPNTTSCAGAFQPIQPSFWTRCHKGLWPCRNVPHNQRRSTTSHGSHEYLKMPLKRKTSKKEPGSGGGKGTPSLDLPRDPGAKDLAPTLLSRLFFCRTGSLLLSSLSERVRGCRLEHKGGLGRALSACRVIHQTLPPPSLPTPAPSHSVPPPAAVGPLPPLVPEPCHIGEGAECAENPRLPWGWGGRHWEKSNSLPCG